MKSLIFFFFILTLQFGMLAQNEKSEESRIVVKAGIHKNYIRGIRNKI